VQELRPGLWTWTAPHPDWTEDQGGPDGWERDVRSYVYDSGGCLVLIDPLEPPSLIEGLIESQDVAVLLTAQWHARSAAQCVERFGATVHAPEPGAEKLPFSAKPYRLADELPGGVVAQGAYYPEEIALWIPAHRALVVGDVVLGGERGVRIQRSWLPEGVSWETLLAGIRPLLDLPIELLLPTHGDPVVDEARETLRDALEA
jgi:glyoxylase-like metal-dependent hydrolase (beta-lactamase superfamily II)